MKKWTVIDNGYRCRKDYKGFGWYIEGNEGSDVWENYIINVPKSLYDSLSDIDKPFVKLPVIGNTGWGYNGERNLGFKNIRDAKKWAEENARWQSGSLSI